MATGESLTVLKLAENIIKLPGSSSQIIPAASRAGDVRDLGADVSKIAGWWKGEIEPEQGLKNLI